MVLLTVPTKLPVLAHVALFILILFIYSFIFTTTTAHAYTVCFLPVPCFRCAASLSQSIHQVAASRQKHTLPDLTYDYGALEPHINAEIMQLHHSKHHATYVNNLNVTEEKYQEALAKGTKTSSPILICEDFNIC